MGVGIKNVTNHLHVHD